jgi:hypothetical protein
MILKLPHSLPRRLAPCFPLLLCLALLAALLAAACAHVRALAGTADNITDDQIPAVYHLSELYIECLSARADLLFLFALPQPSQASTMRLRSLKGAREKHLASIAAQMAALSALAERPGAGSQALANFNQVRMDLMHWMDYYESFAANLQQFIDASENGDNAAFLQARGGLETLYAGFPEAASDLASSIDACRNTAIQSAEAVSQEAVDEVRRTAVLLAALVLAALALGWRFAATWAPKSESQNA